MIRNITMTQVFEDIKQHFDLPGLTIDISQQDIDVQSVSSMNVSFDEALKKAVFSLLNDGSMDESPIWLLSEMPEEYGLSGDINPEVLTQHARTLINESSATLTLFTEETSSDDEWVGVVMNGSTGSKYTIKDYWIFKLVNNPFIDLNYVVVDKSGNQPTCCWGAN